MKKFEYKKLVLLESKLTDEANRLGEEGWEIVALVDAEEATPRDPYSSEPDGYLTFLAKREKTTST